MNNKNTDPSDIDFLLREMKYLNEITQSISEIKPLDILLCEIMESCKTLMSAEASSLLIYNEEENNLFFEVATGEKGSEVKKITSKMGEGIAGWVAENRKPLLIEDCYQDERFNPEYDKKTNFRTKSMICVPMIHKEKLVGVIQVINKKNDDVFIERDLMLFKILASQCAVAIENAKLLEVQIKQEALNRELKTAREIQQNLLPVKLPLFDDLDISAMLIPAKEIGGDYYNILKISENKTLFFIADVTGKSISAALIVSTIYSAVITYFDQNKDKFNLKEFVKSLNRILMQSTTDEKFVTAWIGLFDHIEKTLESVNAGHNETYVFKVNGEKIDLKVGGMFLGILDQEYKSEKISLNKNDVVVYFTDGVNEAMDKDFNQYGDERLVNLLRENLNNNSEMIIHNLLKDLKNFVIDADQSDDITCGVIKVL